MANITDAAKSYLNTVKQMQDGAIGQQTAASPRTAGGIAPDGVSFGDVLKASLNSAIDAQHQSEKTAAAAIVGKADMTDVLQAVNNAELALNTVLAVRDRVVQAYQEVMRTSI